MIKTFRGLLADGGQDKIKLETVRGKVGYRIVKFEIIPQNIGTADIENLVLVWRKEQATIPTSINFTNSDLLASGFYGTNTQGTDQNYAIIFDNEIFNQDVFITNYDHSSGPACNYYLELEVLTLSDDEAQAAILQSSRSG